MQFLDKQGLSTFLTQLKNIFNTRSTEIFGANGVHSNTAGYYQIGDAFYKALTKSNSYYNRITEVAHK